MQFRRKNCNYFGQINLDQLKPRSKDKHYIHFTCSACNMFFMCNILRPPWEWGDVIVDILSLAFPFHRRPPWEWGDVIVDILSLAFPFHRKSTKSFWIKSIWALVKYTQFNKCTKIEKIKVFKTTTHAGSVSEHFNHLEEIFLALDKAFSKFKEDRSPDPR